MGEQAAAGASAACGSGKVPRAVTLKTPPEYKPITSGSRADEALTGGKVKLPPVTATAWKARAYVPARAHAAEKRTRFGHVSRCKEVQRVHHASTCTGSYVRIR
jgi:hypothetical protein